MVLGSSKNLSLVSEAFNTCDVVIVFVNRISFSVLGYVCFRYDDRLCNVVFISVGLLSLS